MREEQKGIAMTYKAGGMDEYKISHSTHYDSPSGKRIMFQEEFYVTSFFSFSV